jgi:hypothetical protein
VYRDTSSFFSQKPTKKKKLLKLTLGGPVQHVPNRSRLVWIPEGAQARISALQIWLGNFLPTVSNEHQNKPMNLAGKIIPDLLMEMS